MYRLTHSIVSRMMCLLPGRGYIPVLASICQTHTSREQRPGGREARVSILRLERNLWDLGDVVRVSGKCAILHRVLVVMCRNDMWEGEDDAQGRHMMLALVEGCRS